MGISKKTLRDIDVTGKRVLMRVDFNVPMKDGVVQDDTRIKAALPSIKYVLEKGCKSLVLMSHLGDPKKDMKKAKEKAEKDGKPFDEKKYIEGKHRMKPVAEYLAKLLGKEVKFAPACMGPETDAIVNALPQGGICMLENTRFHKEETSKEESEREVLATALAKYGDVYVNDAFGTAHRPHASTETVAHHLPAVAGFLMEKELEYLQEKIVKNPAKPFVAVIGGAKVSSKIAVLESLLSKVNTIIIGGGMAYTFLKSKGVSIGKSLVEDEMVETAKGVLARPGDPLQALVDAFLTQSAETAARYLPDGEHGRAGRFGPAQSCGRCNLLRPQLLRSRSAGAADAGRPADREGIPHTQFKYCEDTGQFAVIREQAGTFSDSIRLWSEA